jgi:hypothetical protein
MYPLRDLINQALAASLADPEGPAADFGTYCRLLDVSGERNLHLANPLNPKDSWPVRPRAQSLSGDEPVHGGFLSLSYSAHDDCVLLEDHDDRSALEEFILGGAGILNPFTTYVFAFVDGNLAPYTITYRSMQNGMLLRLDINERDPEEPYLGKRLEWLSID